MAGDWIKFETTTLDKPEVFEMAAYLGIDPDAVVGKCLRVWSWFDSHSRDGNAPVTVLALLNRVAGVANFTNAMQKVGWLLIDGPTVSLPKFDRHNGKTAKVRALGKNRTKKSRSSNDECNGAPVTKPLPEKRREEKSSTHSLNPAQAGEESPLDSSLEQSADPAMRPGFPEKQAVLDYCVSQGWPVTSGSAFWLHYDAAKSNGDVAIGPHWHWWSKLAIWVERDARGLAPNPTARGGGGSRYPAKQTINDFKNPNDWTEEEMSLEPTVKN